MKAPLVPPRTGDGTLHMAISVSQRALLRVRGRGTRAYCRVQLGGSRNCSFFLSRLLLLRLSCFFVADSAPSSWLSSSPHTEFVGHPGYQNTPRPHPVVLTRSHGGYDKTCSRERGMARPPLFLRGQRCVEFACHSRDGLLGEHINAALGSHDVELVSIAATSVVSHNGCHSTALPGRNCKSCWRWLTWKGSEATGVARRGCHEHGLAVVTRFGVASPLLFVLFVVLLEDSASGNSGPDRNPSVEQQSGLPRVSRRQMAFLLGVSLVTRVTAVVST